MNKKLYNEPFFKAVKVQSEDVISTSINSAFGVINGFEDELSHYSESTGEWNMPDLEL